MSILVPNVAGAADRDWLDEGVGNLKEAGNMKFKVGEYRLAIEVYFSVFFSA